MAVEQVIFEKRPHDCDFTAAPLGLKHCHYDSEVVVVMPRKNEYKKLLVTYSKVED